MDGAPCGNGNVTLFKRSSSEFVQQAKDRRSKLLTFLRGTKKERKALKQRGATLYAYFQEVSDVRGRHMVKNLPEQYVLCSFHAFKRAALI